MLKSFIRSYAVNSAAAVMREYQALAVLHSALLNSGIGVVSAAPLGRNEDEWAYLCKHLDGKPLSRMSNQGYFDEGVVARRLVRGLGVFYQSVGGPYGDFKPSNVLVQGNSLGMIDPTTPDPRVDLVASRGSHAPASGDLGYWVYGLVIDTLVGIIRGKLNPSELPRQIRFGRTLVDEASLHFAGSRRSSGFLEEVQGAALQHFLYLMEDRSPRQQVLANAGMRVLAAFFKHERRSGLASSLASDLVEGRAEPPPNVRAPPEYLRRVDAD